MKTKVHNSLETQLQHRRGSIQADDSEEKATAAPGVLRAQVTLLFSLREAGLSNQPKVPRYLSFTLGLCWIPNEGKERETCQKPLCTVELRFPRKISLVTSFPLHTSSSAPPAPDLWWAGFGQMWNSFIQSPPFQCPSFTNHWVVSTLPTSPLSRYANLQVL